MSDSRPIEAVVLDFGGVISKTMFETHRESEAALGLEAGKLQWLGPFDPEGDELWRRMQADEISERDYWLTRAKEVGAMLGEEWTSMQDLVRRARGEDPASVIRPEALAAMASFADNGIKLALLSNELELFYGADFRDRLDFLERFSVIIDASHSEILKPQPRAYEQCIEELQLLPGQCLFIDDQLRNIMGAINVGMQTVHFDVCAPAESYNQALAAANLDRLPAS